MELDLVWERPAIDAYEASIDAPPGLWEDLTLLVRPNKWKKTSLAVPA